MFSCPRNRSMPHREMGVIDPELIAQELGNFFSTFVEPQVPRVRRRGGDFSSRVNVDQNKFEANLDVHLFTPEEICVKVSGDRMVTVEGKHEEKEDEHGFLSRHFVRRFLVPDGFDVMKIESKRSANGTLNVMAPRMGLDEGGDRVIPVIYAKEAKSVEEKKEKNVMEQ